MQRRLEAVVTGVVQGVGFRYTTRSVAVHLGLLGVAENLPDGSVLVVAEGEADGCAGLLAWLRGASSPGVRVPGRVDDVAVTWGEPTGAFRMFTCR